MKDPLNIILFGESGVGKSSLVNLFANLLAYDSFQAAQRGELKTPASHKLKIFDGNFNAINIQVGQLTNDNQQIKSYSFDVQVDGEARSLNVIDTPGVCGTGDLAKDKENFERIIEHIRQMQKGSIALCIVLESTKSELMPEFSNRLRELLVDRDFPASNVCFCFTKARNTNFERIEAHYLIQADIDREEGVQVCLGASNTFFFDSDSFNILAARKNDINLGSLSMDWFCESWTRSAESLSNMIDKIALFKSERFSLNQRVTGPPVEINILLLGEIGVGKSTFINAFYNYLTFDTLEEAMKEPKLHGLVCSTLSFTDSQYNVQTFSVAQNIIQGRVNCSVSFMEDGIDSQANEVYEPGQSSTQHAKAYEFRHKGRLIRLIDTPGIGDSRGISTDQANFKQTIEYLSRLDHLNAVCILLRSNVYRMEPQTRNCIKEIFSHLNKVSIRNVVFFFTNTRGSRSLPSDALSSLRRFLHEEIEEVSQITVPLSHENIVCMDNEAFRYLVLAKNVNSDEERACFNELDEPVTFAESWRMSKEASEKLVKYAETLPVLQMAEMVAYNQSRSMWLDLVQKMIEALSSLVRFGTNQDVMKIMRRLARLTNYFSSKAVSTFDDQFYAQLEQMIRTCTISRIRSTLDAFRAAYTAALRGRSDESLNVDFDDVEAKISSLCSKLERVLATRPPRPSGPPDKTLNLLLVGETGVGKSSLINLFANLLAYDSFEKAQQDQVKCLIPSSFTMVDQNFNEKLIKIGLVESSAVGASITQEAKSYEFDVNIGDMRVHLNFINTPSIGDTQGIEQDKKNFEKIIEFIKRYDGLNAICFVLKPSHSRLTIQFRYCLKELLVKLDRGTAPNICFCYTNARGTSFLPGEGYPVIRSEMADIASKNGVLIPVDQFNTFCFDSDVFRYLAAKKMGMKFGDKLVAGFRVSWEKSAEALKKMIVHAANLSPASVKSIYMLHRARKALLGLARPIEDISLYLRTNILQAERMQRYIQELENNSNSLESRLYRVQVDFVSKALDVPETVCANPSCTKVVELHGVQKIEYSTVCHRGEIDGLTCDSIGNRRIRDIAAFNYGSQENCIKCGHTWQQHLYRTIKFDEDSVQVEDPNVRAMIDEQRRNSAAIAEQNRSVQNLINEQTTGKNWLTNSSAKIAKYIKHKGILYYNPDLEQYLDLLIREEEQKRQMGANNQAVLDGLRKVRREYQTEVMFLTDSLNAGAEVRVATEADIEQLLNELRSTNIRGINLTQYFST